MSQFPSLPLFTDAFIADTGHLSLEERGAYLMLLMCAWRSPGCRLPDDDAKLARMLSISIGRWQKLKPEVLAFWTLRDGFWTQKRLRREHDFVSEKVAKKRAAGALGGRSKTLKNNDLDQASGSENDKQTQSKPKAPTPNPTPTEILTPQVPIDPAVADRAPETDSSRVTPIRRAKPEPQTEDVEAAFDRFRQAYPKREGSDPRKPARDKFVRAVAKGADPGASIAGARAYAAVMRRTGKTGTSFVAQGMTWLNQQRWKDDYGQTGPPERQYHMV